jgi:hypothetical protein
MERGSEGLGIFEPFVGLKRQLLSFSVDFIHEIFVPLIKSKCGWQFFCQTGCFPINMAFLSHSVDIFRYKPIVSFDIHLIFLE